MYESPVETYEKEISHKVVEGFDEYTVKSIIECGIRINRDELTRALFYDRNQYEKGYEDGYKDGKAEQGWISVGDRLPEERDWYLGLFREPDTGWINPVPFICDYLLGAKTKATTKGGWILKGFTDREEYVDYYFNLECIAWMPLPEPYKEGAKV